MTGNETPLGGDMQVGSASDASKTPRDGLDRPLPKRFYKSVAVAEVDDGFQPQLDGRRLNSPGKTPLTVPTRALADEIAQEWDAQGDVICPQEMPQTRLANTAIDRVRGREDEIVAELVKYVETDLLCYRAEHPETLIERQTQAWDPVLAWAREKLSVALTPTRGVMFQTQTEEALSAAAAALAAHDPFELTALHNMTTLSGSAILALAVSHAHLPPEDAWEVAHIDEDFQIEEWGFDAEAAKRRAHRKAEFDNCARMLELIRT